MNRALLTLFAILIAYAYSIANSNKIEDLEKKLAIAKDTAKVNVLLDLYDAYFNSNLDKAESYLRLAIPLSEELNYIEGTIKGYKQLGIVNLRRGDYPNGNRNIKRSIELAEEIGDRELTTWGYSSLKEVYFKMGQMDSALATCQHMMMLAEEIDNQQLLARGNSFLARYNSYQGNYTEAVAYFIEAMNIFESLGDSLAYTVMMGNIGYTFSQAENHEEALKYLKKAYRIHMQMNNIKSAAYALVNMGVAYKALSEDSIALDCYSKGLALAEECVEHPLIMVCLGNIGEWYADQRDFKKSNEFLERAYAMSEETGYNERTIAILGQLANNYQQSGDFDRAEKLANEQLQLAIQKNVIIEQKKAYLILSQIFSAKFNFEKAHEALLGYVKTNDTLFNREKSEQIEKLRTEYETEKKEQEIENLKAINETARYRNISYAGAAISFLILGGLLYYVQRLRTRRNRILLEQEKEVDRMKSRFFANISHEFRTPLTLILGPLDDLISKIEQTSIKKQLNVMQRNAGRLLDLVNQLLDLSKIESGKLKLNCTSSDIISVIKGVSTSFHSMAEQKHIELDLDIQPEQREIYYDRAKFETILTNLLSNAFKFTDDYGKITIKSRIQASGKSKKCRDYIRITVSDNGSGIAQDDINQIFNRFYQADNSQLLQQEGSGIGLALTKELVELHEGKVTAKSEKDKGTQIIVEIPLDLSVSTSQERPEKSSDSEKVRSIHDDRAHNGEIGTIKNENRPVVLVIEDHEDVSNYIQETLRGSYSIISAEDGEEGISKALKSVPDLILSDVMMPKRDGYEVCNALKNDEKTCHIPIILLTAKSDTEDKIEGLQTKADDYVTKPFVPRELLVRIENLIESRARLREKYKNEGVIRPKEITVNSIDEKFLNRLVEIVELNMSNEKFGVEQLGDELSMSRSQLHRKLKALLDQGPNQFIRSFRLQRAHELLEKNSATTSEIAYQVGFSSPSYFTKCFHEQFGYTPSEISADN